MKISFYGVRGSIPTPGPDTIKYGGNTSCVYVELDNGQNIVFDAGTGIRLLGHDLMDHTDPVNIVISHAHWDHIQGYPFFAPIYQAGRKINIYTNEESGKELLCSLFEQMDGNSFPIKVEELPSHGSNVFRLTEDVLSKKGIHLTKKSLSHPGVGFAYKVEEDGHTAAYITDNELDAPDEEESNFDDWVSFCKNVDVLIHDSQYTEADMPHKKGWGHSLITNVRKLAVDAEVGALVMFHHDPERTDAEIDEIFNENDVYFKEQNVSIKNYCAYEGLQIILTSDSDGVLLIETI